MRTTNLVTGILAHVDAGKTTLAESLLYQTGEIRKLGRVDHGNAFLDTYELERARGITIFSKQAQLVYQDKEGTEHPATLLDTPGHVDFSAEMERTLQVLDYAILVIGGMEGVQGHVQTLWQLLKRYHIPVFLFINKMDQPGADKEAILSELKARLDERCVDFTEEGRKFYENAAMCSESLLESFLENDCLKLEELKNAVAAREIFPCYFGSALKLEGVQEFLQGFFRYAKTPCYGKEFGAKIYKIGRDKQGKRLTYLKVTGGSLKAKMLVESMKAGEENAAETDDTSGSSAAEKIDQIRIYSGAQFQAVQEVGAGSICAVTGLENTRCGQGLGVEHDAELPLLEPVLTYQVLVPSKCDVHRLYLQLRELTEEEPQLHMIWNGQLNEIHVQVMGEVQMEILKNMVQERYHVEIGFGSGSIIYKETIRTKAEGVGHFEPLKHYAEVHLLLEPGEPGSGIQFDTACSTDELEKNWQRLILTHLEEKQHKGVLTGSEITDMRITLIAGRAHKKHTEGGDFRQATYRAVRQGLMMAESILLEPVYSFSLEVPSQMIGRALADMERMHGRFDAPQTEGETSILTGFVPAAAMQGYPMEVAAYSGGRGRMSCTFYGYEPCHNAEEVVERIAYDPEADLDNPTGSVFCAHGAGFIVPWDEVYDYCHIGAREALPDEISDGENGQSMQKDGEGLRAKSAQRQSADPYVTEEELQEIFKRTYGAGREERGRWKKRKRDGFDHRSGGAAGRSSASGTGSSSNAASGEGRSYVSSSAAANRNQGEEYLLVDGYNIIFSWEELRELAKVNIESARTKLMDILCDYQGCRKMTLILVLDAYRVEGSPGGVMQYHNIHVVYTKEAETADQYIEKTVHKIGRKNRVTVATSDALEQIIIWGQGAKRLSAPGLLEEIEQAREELRQEHLDKPVKDRNYLFDHLPEELAEQMENIRMGRQEY